MNYSETLQWMFSRLPMYQRQGSSAYRKDLTNILLLAEYLSHPEKKIKTVHVAGTNGKGSTSHMLASILMEAGYKTGLYTSPHLKDFRERIKTNGQDIPEAYVISFIKQHKPFFEKHELSFFEMTVGLAFDYFAAENVDVAIIETGMGGRLDATNIIEPELSVITNIGLDHTQFLGETLEQIAAEKAGIIKPGVPVVIGESDGETENIFRKKAEENKSEIVFADKEYLSDFPSDLKGLYQVKNRKTVLASVNQLRKHGWQISDDAVRSGLLNTVSNTRLLGRWQQLGSNPMIIADTAHNKHGLQATLPQIDEYDYEKLHVVLGTVNDKNLAEVLPLFPKNAAYYFCKPDIPRGLDAETLASEAKKFGLTGDIYNSVSQAYLAAKQAAAPNDFIYVGGSTFVVAEIL